MPANVAEAAVSLFFCVEVDGVDLGAFKTLTGLSARYDVVEYHEGGENDYLHRFPGALSYSNVTLSRPIDAKTPSLGGWFSKLKNEVKRRTGSITAYDSSGNKVAKWDLEGVIPVEWTGPSLSIDSNTIATESLVLAYNQIV